MGTGTATPPRIYTQLHLQEEHHTTWASKHASPPGVDGKTWWWTRKKGDEHTWSPAFRKWCCFAPWGVGGIDTLLLCVWHHSGDPGYMSLRSNDWKFPLHHKMNPWSMGPRLTLDINTSIYTHIVGGWTNPIERYVLENGINLPQFRGKNDKPIRNWNNHH